ncbi:MAG TPA: ABC transporter ATP-binding protein [Candidatus Polarisedimenticolia bacterium]|nr:ABC transporter ATP-binding protein [Candidatus Polarisedimenticolia bacterium]
MTPASNDTTAISISGLSKSYGRIRAVKSLSLDVTRGEVFGFLGLNGAGKTTTIRILLDLLRPGAGSAHVLGRDCQRDGLEVRARVGYLPGEMGYYGDMTGRRTLDLLARLSGRPIDARRRGALLERLQLSAADLDRRLREYSSGMKRKLGIVSAFQADPELLILDEPTEGLDPLMQEEFYALLVEWRRSGRTVFMSSHVLSEVERICDRVGLIRQGDLVVLSTVERIRNLAPRRVQVIFERDVEPRELPPGPYRMLETQARTWSVSADGPLGPLLAMLQGLPVADLKVEEPRLEDILVRYYRDAS